MDKFLVTGGAGYIGRHVVLELVARGINVDVLDLIRPSSDLLIDGVENYLTVDIRDAFALDCVFSESNYKGIYHLAGKKSVPHSFIDPGLYFSSNVLGTQNVVRAAIKHQIRNIVFSSSCSVYGNGSGGPVDECSELKPISPYAQSKVNAERILFAASDSVRIANLRFFNVIGCARKELRDFSEDSLVPSVLAKLEEGERPIIYGASYPTRDGTAIRDFIDVRDLSILHHRAMELLIVGKSLGTINLGVGKGVSVKEVVTQILKLHKMDESIEFRDARPGDPASIWSNTTRANELLGSLSFIRLDESLKSVF